MDDRITDQVTLLNRDKNVIKAKSTSVIAALKRIYHKHFRKLCQTGCYMFIFFTTIKLIALLAILTFGVEYLPIQGALEKLGLCKKPVLTLIRPNCTCSQANISATICNTKPAVPLTCPTLQPASQPVTNTGNLNVLQAFPGLKDVMNYKEPEYEPRLMCMIFTTPSAWQRKATAVNETWVPRCDIHRFYYSGSRNAKIPTPDAVPLGVPEGRDHLTAKTMRALRSAYFDHVDNVDWFFKADDDTYVIVENLRWLLSHFDPHQPHYVGGRSMELLKHGYNGGGAGYALSRGAVKKIVEESHLYPKGCKQDGGMEDLDIGVCLEQFKIYPVDTKDFINRMTFHTDHPYKIFANQGDNRRVYTYRKNEHYHGNPNGIRVMSPFTISFHYLEPGHMYMYDFLLYDIVRHQPVIAAKKPKR